MKGEGTNRIEIEEWERKENRERERERDEEKPGKKVVSLKRRSGWREWWKNGWRWKKVSFHFFDLPHSLFNTFLSHSRSIFHPLLSSLFLPFSIFSSIPSILYLLLYSFHSLSSLFLPFSIFSSHPYITSIYVRIPHGIFCLYFLFSSSLCWEMKVCLLKNPETSLLWTEYHHTREREKRNREREREKRNRERERERKEKQRERTGNNGYIMWG